MHLYPEIEPNDSGFLKECADRFTFTSSNTNRFTLEEGPRNVIGNSVEVWLILTGKNMTPINQPTGDEKSAPISAAAVLT